MRSLRLNRFSAFAAVALFLALQTISLAHELDHTLAQHDNPACALHLFHDHGGKSLASLATVALAPAAHLAPLTDRTQSVPRSAPVPFHSRAPPRSFV